MTIVENLNHLHLYVAIIILTQSKFKTELATWLATGYRSVALGYMNIPCFQNNQTKDLVNVILYIYVKKYSVLLTKQSALVAALDYRFRENDDLIVLCDHPYEF